jgi:hypothetical protein
VQVRLNPAHDASGHDDIWLNGTFCGTYQEPMADRDYGAHAKVRPSSVETRTRRDIPIWPSTPAIEIAKDRSHLTTLRDPLPAECSGRL